MACSPHIHTDTKPSKDFKKCCGCGGCGRHKKAKASTQAAPEESSINLLSMARDKASQSGQALTHE